MIKNTKQQQMIGKYLTHLLKAREIARELASQTACYSKDFPDWKRCGDLERATELCYTMTCGIQNYSNE